MPVCARVSRQVTGDDFRKKVKSILPKFARKEGDKVGEKPAPGTLSYDQRQQAERLLDYQLGPLLVLTQAFATLLSSSWRHADKAFGEVLKIWKDTRGGRAPYQTRSYDNLFRLLGLEIALFSLHVRDDLKPASVRKFLTIAHEQGIATRTFIQIVAILAQRKPLQDLAGEQAQRARTLIEAEDDVTLRATLFADLGRAMLPASIEDASVYFRNGLEQMDAIGSGDYFFTNELLLFAARLKGGELDETEFHTLTNICELNMGDEPQKFYWGAFARGLSKTAGPRGLAKLSRLDDRSKIGLDHTLLPYLIALVEDGKMEPEVSLCLNRLAEPAELWYNGTAEFAQVIRSKGGTARPDIVSELIQQFEDNHPTLLHESIVKALAALAEETPGVSPETTVYLSAAQKRFAQMHHAQSDHKNGRDDRLREHVKDQDRDNRAAIQAIASATNPTGQNSLAQAITAINDLQHIYDLKGKFFESLRAKVPFSGRTEYIRNVCALEHLNFYWKLAELKECKETWRSSSAALGELFKSQAVPLVCLHADDLVTDDRFSGSQLNDIAELTGVSNAVLVLELIKASSHPDTALPGAVWLAFASFIVAEADEGQGQLALGRLLRSDAAKLADSVVDGAWKKGLYPESNVPEIAAGLVWRMLGSPYAEARWRAAHSLRCFARFGRWDIIGSVVRSLTSGETAGPFQASELAFYFLHARLWLLIALARTALDYPREIARYKEDLLKIATEEENRHVLMRHFAACALLACIDAGELKMPADAIASLRQTDLSPHPRLNKKIRNGGGFYEGRPRAVRKPSFEFHLDYDFHKHDVDNLSHVFGKSIWEVEDIMSETVHRLAPNISGMHETGDRNAPDRNSYGMTSSYHTLGQQLGWHALFFAAGKLLRDSPVTDDWWYEEDPWGDWMSRYVLTRDDGLWLSDGMDRPPLDTARNLLENAKDGLALTGDQDKLLGLVGITSRIGKYLVVEGSWRSSDNIRVHISSALVPHDKAQRLARRLTREDPMVAWLPKYEGDNDGNEYLSINRKKEYTPWIVDPSGEVRLDEHDPFGAPCANVRSRLARDYTSALSLTSTDPFGRTWQDKRNRVPVRAQAWGRENSEREGGPYSSLRLLCSSSLIRSLLRTSDKDLLLLISLQRYEGRSHGSRSRFTHTIAVVQVAASLDFEYFRGRVNHVHKSRF